MLGLKLSHVSKMGHSPQCVDFTIDLLVQFIVLLCIPILIYHLKDP